MILNTKKINILPNSINIFRKIEEVILEKEKGKSVLSGCGGGRKSLLHKNCS